MRKIWDFLKVRKKVWLLPIVLILGASLGLSFLGEIIGFTEYLYSNF